MEALLLHGEAGGWDELAIAVVAFGVLWVAVKLAGRKSADADDEDEDENEEARAAAKEEEPETTEPPAGRRG
jgi:hypothetical protein